MSTRATRGSAKGNRFGVVIPETIHAMSSAEALPILAERCEGRVLVSFSGGKDSVAAVLALRPHFPEMHLYHMYTLPGLRIVEEGLQYFERLWGLRITRVPHPFVWEALQQGFWQPYHRLPLLERFGIEVATYDEVAREVRRDLGWSKAVPQAVGIRMDDSIFRAAGLKKTGAYQRSRHVIYPVFDWTRAQLRNTLIETGTRLPPEYRFFGRSFSGDGLDYKFIAPLKAHYPDDYARIRRWFPCIDAEIHRYEFQRRREKQAKLRRTSFSLN
jgi:3'-phosphoadenosine 5'-phosphosulfate sulfotransferase (PAPS reductase)/FAD synthetase